MGKYLTEEQLTANLRSGKYIEQWLPSFKHHDYVVLRWIRIDQEKDLRYSISYFESFDEGSEDFFDIYEFSLVDPDEPFGVINTFDTIDEVLKFAVIKYFASIQRFVSVGIIQDEYLNYLRS
jgi:hypothetical protein